MGVNRENDTTNPRRREITMEASMLTITPQTIDETKLTKFKIGEIRWKKLKELEDEGKLAQAENRMDVISMMGYAREIGSAPYIWLSRMIARGHLVEEPHGYGKSAYYTNGSGPDYDHKKQARNRRKTNRLKALAKTETKPVARVTVPDTKPVPVLSKSTGNARITITQGDMTIAIENISESSDIVERIISQLAKKQ